MRVCRVCLSNEENEPFQSIFKDGFATAKELFYISEIIILESNNFPALICTKCITEVSNAARLKQISLVADLFFKNLTKNFVDQHFEEFKRDQQEVEALDENMFEIIEYDGEDTIVEALDEEFVNEEVVIVEEAQPKRSYAARKPGGGRQHHPCECGISFSSLHRLRNHIKVKHEFISEADLLPCLTCGKKFKIQEYLELHIRNQHTEYPLSKRKENPCSFCGKMMSSVTALRNHEEKHALESEPRLKLKMFVCDCCGKSFRLKSYLYNHLHNVHIRQKYSCTFCSRGFYKKYEMIDHVRQNHTMETPYHCEFEGCAKSFSRKKNYVIHRRIHTGEKPYKCDWPECEKSFIHFIDRKRHMMKHTGERPFTCSVCQKGFIRVTELETHMKSHN